MVLGSMMRRILDPRGRKLQSEELEIFQPLSIFFSVAQDNKSDRRSIKVQF